jgi:hypothetical protein
MVSSVRLIYAICSPTVINQRFILIPANSTELSPFWGTAGRSATEEYPNILCNAKVHYHVRYEVFTAVTMKNAVFWDVAPCRSCELNRRFGRTYRLSGATCSRWFRSRIFLPWRLRRYVSPKRRSIHEIYTAPHPQKTAFFTFITMLTRVIHWSLTWAR